MRPEIRNKPFKLVIGAIMIIALFASVLALKPPTGITVPAVLQTLLWPEPKPLTAFNLLTSGQKSFNLESLSGKWTLLFFGYTHCPDVCPLALTVMKAAYSNLAQYPEIQGQTQFVFVSVDPARDTPEHTGQYVSYFDASFIGATGEVTEIDNLAEQLNAGYYIKDKPDDSEHYNVDHTNSIYLIGPKQQAHGAFMSPHFPDTIVSQLLEVIELRGSGLRKASALVD